MREAELKMRREPFGLQAIAEIVQFFDHVGEVSPDKVGQHETVMQFGAPALQARWLVRALPEVCD